MHADLEVVRRHRLREDRRPPRHRWRARPRDLPSDRRTRCAAPAHRTRPASLSQPDVEDPPVRGVAVGVAGSAREPPAVLSASGHARNAVPTQAPAAPAASTAATPRAEEMPPAASTGDRVSSSTISSSGSVADLVAAMPARLGATSDDDVDTCGLRQPGIGHDCRPGWQRRCPSTEALGSIRSIVAEAHRNQGRQGIQAQHSIELATILARAPTPSARRRTACRTPQRLPPARRSSRASSQPPTPIIPSPTGCRDGRRQPPTANAGHRGTDDGRGETEASQQPARAQPLLTPTRRA